MENPSKMSNQEQKQDSTPEQGQKKPNNIHKRGFASMDRDTQRRIASKGGREAHRQGVAHQWNSEQARIAGKKGGQISGERRSAKKRGTADGNTSVPTEGQDQAS